MICNTFLHSSKKFNDEIKKKQNDFYPFVETIP